MTDEVNETLLEDYARRLTEILMAHLDSLPLTEKHRILEKYRKSKFSDNN